MAVYGTIDIETIGIYGNTIIRAVQFAGCVAVCGTIDARMFAL